MWRVRHYRAFRLRTRDLRRDINDNRRRVISMNYIAHLKSLPETEMKKAMESQISKFEKALLNDRARIKLLDEDDPYAWSDLDEVIIDSFVFNEATSECVAEIIWISTASGNEDDERSMHGHATAHFKVDGIVKFSDVSAELE